MSSTESDLAHRIVVDRLPMGLRRLVDDEPDARVVVLIVSSDTADDLGLAVPARTTRGAARRAALTRRRQEMGMTQEDLAHAIGVQTSTVGRWERGLTKPSIWARERLCAVLDVSPVELDTFLGEAGSDPIRVLHVVGPGDGTGAEEAVPAPEIE